MRLEDMYPAALAIVLIGIVLGIGLFVLAETRVGIAQDYTGLDVNQNISSATTLGDASKTEYGLVRVVSVTFADDATSTIPSSNYTTVPTGVITWTAPTNDSGRLVNISSTYNYDVADKPETALTSFITGVGDFADWIAIIVVVIAAAIILGIVLSSFGRQPGV